MNYTTVKLTSGVTLYGPIWEYRPKDGWFAISDVETQRMVVVHLKDVTEAITKNQFLTATKVGDRDEVQRAKDEGWDGT
jgi:hypothetical protein